MRTYSLCMLVILSGLGLAGCPDSESEPNSLVGAEWTVTVTDTNGAVAPSDEDGYLGALSGRWYFNSDGTMRVEREGGASLNGTYTVDGANVQFQVAYNSLSEGVEENYGVSGTLVHSGKAFSGTGTYTIMFSDEDAPDDSYSMTGYCVIHGEALEFSWWALVAAILCLLATIFTLF